MMKIRDRYLDHFRATARDIFTKRPELRSVVLAVSQYWNDEADDAVHEWIVGSERELPLWPHLCDGGWHDDDDNPVEAVPGELCTSCAELLGERGYLEWWHDNSDAIAAFEAMCHESGTQDQPDAYNALPAAIARKRGEAIEVELLGPVLRPHSMSTGETATEHAKDPTWADPRALELYEQVCTSPADEGPRRVLADYLLEREMPRGELLAYGLAHSPAYADLLVRNRATWLAPLERIVVSDTAKFDRGLLSDIEVFAVDRAHRGHPALSSVERLHVHAGSTSLLHPSMRALRELGPINRAWLEDLVAASRPWAIETLDVEFSDEGMVAMLASAANLPALRHLIVRGEFAARAAGAFTGSAWWRHLQRLTCVELAPLPKAWLPRQALLGVPWLAVRIGCTDPVRTDGWEIAFGPDDACEVTLRGFTPEATRESLKKLLAAVPRPTRTVKLVASRFYTPATVDAEYLSRDGQVVT